MAPSVLSHGDCAPGAGAEDCITSARRLWRVELGSLPVVVRLDGLAFGSHLSSGLSGWKNRTPKSKGFVYYPQWGAESSLAGQWLPDAGGDRAWDVEMCTVRCCPLWHPAHCPMGTVPRVLVRRTASPAHADFGGLSSGAAPVVVRLDVVPLPPRSSAPTVAGCRLGGYPAGCRIGGVESALREGCPRTMTGVSQCCFSGHF